MLNSRLFSPSFVLRLSPARETMSLTASDWSRWSSFLGKRAYQALAPAEALSHRTDQLLACVTIAQL
jgi:hypothetical protein